MSAAFLSLHEKGHDRDMSKLSGRCPGGQRKKKDGACDSLKIPLRCVLLPSRSVRVIVAA